MSTAFGHLAHESCRGRCPRHPNGPLRISLGRRCSRHDEGGRGESADYLADLALRLDDIRADRELLSQMLHDMWPMPAMPKFARVQPKDRAERYALVHAAFPDYGSLLDVVHAFAFYLDECSRLAGEASSTTYSEDLLIRRHRAVAMDRARNRKQAVWNALMNSNQSGEALNGVLTGHSGRLL